MYIKLAQHQTLSWNFAITHCYLLRDVMFQTIIAKFTETTEVDSSKIDM